MAGKYIDVLAGTRCGRLTTTGKFKHVGKSIVWHCVCDCGNETYVRGYTIRNQGKNGRQKSCGCWKREDASRRMHAVLCTPENRAKSGLARRKPDAAFREVLYRYKKGAKSRGLEFLLTDEEFRILTQAPCFYCGAEPHRIFETTNAVEQFVYNGVDRKDNNIGYILENSLPCCWLCNKLKAAVDFDIFISQILKIASVHGRSSEIS